MSRKNSKNKAQSYYRNKVENKLKLSFRLLQRGEFSQAKSQYKEILQQQPNHTDANFYLGLIYRKQGELSKAVECYQRAIHSKPNHFQAINNLGNAYKEQGKSSKAVQCYQKLIELQPDCPYAYYNLGVIYGTQEKFTEALKFYQKSVELEDSFVGAHYNIGTIYQRQGKLSEASQSYQKVIQSQPNHASAYCGLGLIYKEQNKFSEAISSYQRALQLNPSFAEAHHNLGLAKLEQGKIVEAIASYQRALQLKPDCLITHSNLLLALNYSSNHEPSEIYRAHRQWAECQAASLVKAIQPHNNDRTLERRLRIGYVSGDFKTHSVAYFLEPLLADHHHDNFEIICYANNQNVDATTKRLQNLVDGWRDIQSLKDEQVANLVRRDRIDILVDLSGHTKGNRILLFARKPAPIQVSYIGYPNTTGLETMDYRFTDAWADLEGQTEHLHTEQLVRLPEGFLCYKPPSDCPEVSSSPVLKTGQITFGSFNNLAKVNPQVIGYMSAILSSVSQARMIIKARPLADCGTQDYVYGLFQQNGISSDRVELLGWTPSRSEHLALYNRVDIALDTFPYNGTTTTCEAMWMGVPVITLAGQAHTSRVGVSLLSSVGLEEMIATSAEDYIQKAITLAGDLQRLQNLRGNLRTRMKNAPLTNIKLNAQILDKTYRKMWQNFCHQSLLETDELICQN